MNNSNNCLWYYDVGIVSYYFYNAAVVPLMLMFGLAGHSLSLISFYHESKKESAYGYLIIGSICEIVVVVTRALYAITVYWLSGYENRGGVEWFMSCQACMWATAHFAMPLENAFATVSLLLAVSIAADRVFAMGKPFLYRHIDHRRHLIIACVCCLLVGVSTSIFDCFRFYLSSKEGGGYKMVADDAFLKSSIGNAFSELRNVVRLIGVVALIACNAALVKLYRANTRRVESMTNSIEADRRHQKQKVILIICFCQSVFNTLTTATYIFYYAMWYENSWFFACYGPLADPIIDSIIDIFDMADCYAVFAFSKSYRNMIYSSIKCLQRIGSNQQSSGGTSRSTLVSVNTNNILQNDSSNGRL